MFDTFLCFLQEWILFQNDAEAAIITFFPKIASADNHFYKMQEGMVSVCQEVENDLLGQSNENQVVGLFIYRC